jgi:protein SCO1/2
VRHQLGNLRSRTSRQAGSLLLLVLLASMGCQRVEKADTVSDGAGDSGSSAASSDVSLYDLNLTFTNQDAEAVPLQSLAGRPLIASMMYTSCKSACPRIAADLRRIQDQVPDGGEHPPLFVMWSLDPERDTPEAMQTFARESGLDLNRWQMLSGTKEGVLELAAVLDVRYREEENGEIAHSSLVFVIDEDGHIVHRQLSAEGDDPLLAAVASLARP